MNQGKNILTDELKVSACTQCLLKEFSVFRDCSSDVIQDIFSNKQLMQFKKDEVIVKQGDSFRGVFCIQNGSVKVLKESANNKKMILWFAKPGGIIGMDSFVSDDDYSFSAFACAEVNACFIPKSDFIRLIAKEPSIARKLMEDMCSKINSIEERITSMSGKKIKEQFAEMLISIAMKNKNFSTGGTPIEYSIKDIANIIGTTNNYLYKILSDFNSRKVISIRNKKLVINDFDKLSRIAIGDEAQA
jgi:CRP/FNR family transcriptional regulator